jgi:hypothetical protein
VGKCGDLTAAKGALTKHQAALTVTVFGHRISRAPISKFLGSESGLHSLVYDL